VMHPKRPKSWMKARRPVNGKRFTPLFGLERKLIRVMVICTVLLSIFQITTVTDPVDFYLKIAGDIDSPAFKYDQYVNDNPSIGQQEKTIRLCFSVHPESAVFVLQNEKNIGTIEKDTELDVAPGTVVLDARHIPYPVVVDVVLNEKKHQIELNGDMKSFEITFKSNASS